MAMYMGDFPVDYFATNDLRCDCVFPKPGPEVEKGVLIMALHYAIASHSPLHRCLVCGIAL